MKFQIMDHTGHSTLEFPDWQKAEAAELFNKLLEDGRTAATRYTGSPDYKVIRDPSQLLDETLFIPQLKGG